MIGRMRPPIFVRPLTEKERVQFEAGLRSAEAFMLRRSQIVLGSSRGERAPATAKALGCYGLLVREGAAEQVWLRFVDGRPVSALTQDFLTWLCDKAQALGTRVLALVWDNASWHRSKAVRTWVREHNQQVKLSGQAVLLLICPLPPNSPSLN